MGFIRSLEGFQPPDRFDGTPFNQALLQESASSAGPWTTIQTINLQTGPGVSPTGLDADPSQPQERSFTTTQATIDPKAWYRVVWKDASSNTFNGDPVLFDDTVPTLASVQDVLNVLRLDSVTSADESRIQADIRAAESWAKRVLHDPHLGSTASSVTESFFGERVVPYTGTLVSVQGIPYPGADPVDIPPSDYWDMGNRIRILTTTWIWPGLPEDEKKLSEQLMNWEIRVTTNRSAVAIDPQVIQMIAFAAASLWVRGPLAVKGFTSESIGDYSYSFQQRGTQTDPDPFFAEAKRLARGLRRRTGIVVP